MNPRIKLKTWFLKNRRKLPWRQSGKNGLRNPYKTWVSEIMLQQTQVSTVVDYFTRWMKEFPTITKLAQADEESVLKMWSGLGYYNRARNLLKGARQIADRYKGNFPQIRSDVLALPGVGEYTAGAILSLALGRREPILDGNIIRIFSRYYDFEFLPVDSEKKDLYWNKARWWANCPNPNIINEALMELGALVCLKQNPRCGECPLKSECRAFIHKKTRSLPPVKPRKKTEKVPGFAFVIKRGGRYLLTKDNDFSVLKHQWMFPGRVTTAARPRKKQLADRLGVKVKSLVFKKGPEIRHSIMNYVFELGVYTVEIDGGSQVKPDIQGSGWFTMEQLDKNAVSSFSKKILIAHRAHKD